jgi:hypothetical protein
MIVLPHHRRHVLKIEAHVAFTISLRQRHLQESGDGQSIFAPYAVVVGDDSSSTTHSVVAPKHGFMRHLRRKAAVGSAQMSSNKTAFDGL